MCLCACVRVCVCSPAVLSLFIYLRDEKLHSRRCPCVPAPSASEEGRGRVGVDIKPILHFSESGDSFLEGLFINFPK